MWDYEILGVWLKDNDLEPEVFPKPLIAKIPMKIPFISGESWWNQKELIKSIYTQQFIIDHEKFRNTNWFKYKISRNPKDFIARYSSSIMSSADLGKKEEEIEKLGLEFFRECIVREELERALVFAGKYFKKQRSLEVCVSLCNKLNLGTIAEKINEILSVSDFSK